jgi:pimeloyl-ACP methyl ester carboxylesterase
MATNEYSTSPDTRRLTTPDGTIGYDVAGDGQLVVLVPGMGDLRSSFRFLAPNLRAAGYRVACTDLRGHGDSDTTFGSYGDGETASDVLALVEHLGGPAVLVGNSMGAGAAVIAAAERPDLVSALVLVGPFVRDHPISVLTRAGFRLAMLRPWAAAAWKAYLPKLYAGARPSDLKDYLKLLDAALHRPGYTSAFIRTTRISHAPAEARLAEVKQPVLVVMGAQDPDFEDPAAEAGWVAERLGGQILMVPDAGHYPQSQQPDVVADAVIGFVGQVR